MNYKKTIIDFIKRNSVVSSIGYYMRSLFYETKMGLYNNIPLENKVFFYRGGRGFADNQRFISLYLHQTMPHLKQVWACDTKHVVDSLPDYIEPVIINSSYYFKQLSSSKVWVASVLMPHGTLKRKEQLYIQTWHGDRALKKIVNDALDNENYRKHKHRRHIIENTMCDYIVTGSKAGEQMFRSALAYQGTFLKCGCPRNDLLFRIDQTHVKEIRNRLNIEDGINIALYAPTFRDHAASQGEVDSDIDLLSILDSLEAKTHLKWVMLIRAHGAERLKTQREIENRILDVTQYPDISDLLMITDFLFTDYSSCATDFAITGRPVILYQDDYDEYTSKDRSLYFKMEESPFFRACNMKELIKIIEVITPEKAMENDKKILDFFGTYENGTATAKVCSVITDWLSKQ